MRWEVVAWGALALVLFAAEALAPGAFMLWIGIGAAAVFVLVAVFADIPLLWQVVAFVVPAWFPSSAIAAGAGRMIARATSRC